jgi:glycerate kinase
MRHWKKQICLLPGEGGIDLQTLEGKAPYGVAARAKKKKLPVIALAGKTPAQSLPELNELVRSFVNINEENTNIG